MYFAGRWVPMDVMDAILVLWLVVGAVMGALMFILRRRGRATKDKPMPSHHPDRSKRRRRKAR
jgi:hypothetical protein